jgi:hypothetical protein
VQRLDGEVHQCQPACVVSNDTIPLRITKLIRAAITGMKILARKNSCTQKSLTDTGAIVVSRTVYISSRRQRDLAK